MINKYIKCVPSDNAGYRPVTSEIAQSTGTSETKVMSQKASTESIRKIDNRTQGIDSNINDSFNVADSQGNVIMAIDENGVHTTELEAGKVASEEVEADALKAITVEAETVVVEDCKADVIDANSITANQYEDSTDEFVVSDKNGKIALKVDNEGLHAAKLVASQMEVESYLVDKLETDVCESGDDAFYVVDKKGYVAAKIDANGVHAKSIDTPQWDEPRSWLKGKHMYVVGDSLTTSGVWAEEIARQTGAIYNHALCSGLVEDINYKKPTVYGGGSSWGYRIASENECGGTQRFKNLIRLKKEYNLPLDVVFIENINDLNVIGPVEDNGYITKISDSYIYESKPIYPVIRIESEHHAVTAVLAKEYFFNNIISEIGNSERGYGMNYCQNYTATAKVLTITGSPTAGGDMLITVGGILYSIAVTAGMTIADVVHLVEEINFPNYTGNASGNSITFIDTINNAPTITFNANGTGVTATITESSVDGELNLYYDGDDISDSAIADSTKWKYWYNIAPSIASWYKGLIEWLQKELPDTVFIWVIAPRVAMDYVNIPSYAIGVNSTINRTAMLLNNSQLRSYEALCELQKQICSLYGIQYLDIKSNWGISYNNAYPTYYPNNNVHMKTEGYQRWGEVAARLLK